MNEAVSNRPRTRRGSSPDEERTPGVGLGGDLCCRCDLVETRATSAQRFVKDGLLCGERALGAAIEETSLQQRGREPCPLRSRGRPRLPARGGRPGPGTRRSEASSDGQLVFAARRRGWTRVSRAASSIESVEGVESGCDCE